MKNGTRQITVGIPEELDDKLESILRHRGPKGKPLTKSGLIQDAINLWGEDYIAKFEVPSLKFPWNLTCFQSSFRSKLIYYQQFFIKFIKRFNAESSSLSE